MNREKLIGLVTQAQSGDSQALDVLFTEFYNDVYYFALKTVKDSDTACDITQETFLEIIRTIGNLKEPAAFVTWMKQITYHQCTRYFNKKKDELVEEDEDGNTIFDTLADESEGSIPSEVLEKEEFRQTILAMIDKLTEEQRSAVMMYYFDELTVGQIAQIQGVSEGTVKSRLNYARKAVRKSVEDYEKKTGIKLHSFAFLPLFLLFFGKELMPEAKAAEIHTTVTASANATMAGTVGAASATAATASTSVGVLTKLAQLPLIGKIVAAILAVVLVVGMGVLIAKPDTEPNQENQQQNVAGETENAGGEAGTAIYASRLLAPFLPSLTYKDVFAEYAGGYMLGKFVTTDGRIVDMKEPFVDKYYGAFEDVQECCLISSAPAYYDSKGVLHIIISDDLVFPCPGLKGQATLFTTCWTQYSDGSFSETGLCVISRDENGYLYKTEFDKSGVINPEANGIPLCLRDDTTGTKIRQVGDISITNLVGVDQGSWRIEAAGMVYEATLHMEADGEDLYIPAKNTGIQAENILTSLGATELIYKDTAKNVIYIHDQPVIMPEGKTTEQITKAFSGTVSMIMFDDGTVYLNGYEAPSTELQYSEELTELNKTGKIKMAVQSMGENAMVYLVLDDNLTYIIHPESTMKPNTPAAS